MAKKVLICGATGFIGRNIAERLAKDESYNVFGSYNKSPPYSNDKINFIKADFLNKHDTRRIMEGKDIIINAAAVTTGSAAYRAEKDIFPNIRINSNIIESSYKTGPENFIFLSCSVMYPSSEKPLREEDADVNLLHEKYYISSRMKVFFEDMCNFFSKTAENKTRFTVIRHSNIYGPYDKFDLERSHVFGATITKIMKADNNSIVRVWGGGEEERDFLYVEDLVDFILLALKKQKNTYEIYNVGLGKSISVKSLTQKVIDTSGKNLKIEYDITKEGIKTKLALDYSKADLEIGWRPRVSLEEGIKRTMEWYKNNINKQ